jgi:hypothetical protein
MGDPPFGLRDYLAYGITGLIVVLAVEVAYRGHVPLSVDLTAAQGVVLAVVSYLVGHVVAETWATRVLRFVNRRAAEPVNAVMSDVPRSRLFTGYLMPLAAPTRRNIEMAAATCGLAMARGDNGRYATGDCQALREIATAVVREVHATPDRIARYGTLEDVSRNLFAAAVCSVPILVVGAVGHHDASLGLAAGAMVAFAMSMWYRHLHFRRLYWAVVLPAFAAYCLGHGVADAQGTRQAGVEGD